MDFVNVMKTNDPHSALKIAADALAPAQRTAAFELAAEVAHRQRATEVDVAHLAIAFAQAVAGLTRHVLEDRGVDLVTLERASHQEPPAEPSPPPQPDSVTAAPQPQAVSRQQTEPEDDLFLPDGQLKYWVKATVFVLAPNVLMWRL